MFEAEKMKDPGKKESHRNRWKPQMAHRQRVAGNSEKRKRTLKSQREDGILEIEFKLGPGRARNPPARLHLPELAERVSAFIHLPAALRAVLPARI